MICAHHCLRRVATGVGPQPPQVVKFRLTHFPWGNGSRVNVCGPTKLTMEQVLTEKGSEGTIYAPREQMYHMPAGWALQDLYRVKSSQNVSPRQR